MKMNHVKKISGGVLALMLGAAIGLQAQPRPGGGGGFGGGGFGGFGGFGGGGFGGGFNRGGGGSSSSSTYNNNGTVGNAVIQVDPATHNLIVIADRQTSEQIRQVIESMDMPVPQVLIKVVFLEVQHNDGSVIGVQGQFTGGSVGGMGALTGFITNGLSFSPTNGIVPTGVSPKYSSFNVGNNFNLPQSLAGAAGNGGLYQVLGNDFTATIQAVAAAGKSQVLSRPSVLVRDGQQAQIVVGQEIYLPSGVAYASVGTTGATVPTINGTYQNVGIILNVTPFIGDNNLVQMILEPQTSELDTSTPGQVITYGNSLLGSQPVYAPNINIRSANTVVITPDAQTVVIGGLISDTKSASDSKIPFLGDIPLLGNLFKTSAKATSKTELLMFLTPHIMKAPSQLSGMSAAELNRSVLITNSVSEQELDRFLERVPVKKTK
jgi:general secretion pathway protein D